jgi:D-tyrosyl-tRNA(Tyr) deacylase
MVACIQRCTRAEVRVEGRSVGSIGRGLLVFLAVEKGDDDARADRLADRLLEIRIFEDVAGKLDRSAREAGAELLVVSQFTLAARLDRGRRPSFDRAAPPAEANALYERVIARLRSSGLRVATGSFGARMAVELVNDGPVTFIIEES